MITPSIQGANLVIEDLVNNYNKKYYYNLYEEGTIIFFFENNTQLPKFISETKVEIIKRKYKKGKLYFNLILFSEYKNIVCVCLPDNKDISDEEIELKAINILKKDSEKLRLYKVIL